MYMTSGKGKTRGIKVDLWLLGEGKGLIRRGVGQLGGGGILLYLCSLGGYTIVSVYQNS